LDANYASAYTGLADAYALMTANEQMDASAGVPRGMEAARQAVLRDPDSAEAHAALGLLHYCRWEWPEADREYRTALQLNPNYGFLYVRMAMVSVAFGRFEEAEQLLQRGRAADPFSMSIPNTLAQVYLYWRRPAAAIQLSKQILGLSPSDDVSHQTLAIAYFEQGDFEAATREEEMWERFSPNDLGNELGGLPLRAKTIGRAKASRIFSEIEQKASRGAFVGELNLAFGAIAVDERQQAMSYLKLAYRNHVTDLVCARWYPAFDPLHGDPEFEQIFKDMGVAGK
jgi:serine/threonine-protein kinase